MSAPAAPVIRATGVSAGYAGLEVVHSISVEAAPGETLAIVGPNGAGKSTLLRVLSGSHPHSAGEVELLGRALDSFDRRSLARAIATVAQENAIAFQFTVLEVVLMGRAPHLGAFRFETPRDLEIAREALAEFDLLGFAHRHIQELSGGERKSVFLARALAQQPALAMLDEPTAFLDVKHVANIFTRFRKLARERGMAVIATLHDLNVAALYADRVLLMKEGAAAAFGAPEQVLTAENLRRVYDTALYVGRNPVTGTLAILPGER